MGTEVELYLTWDVDRHFSLNGTAAYFWAGDFFALSQPRKDVAYGALWASYKF